MNEAADFFVGGCGGAALVRTARTGFQVAAGTETVKQERGETFAIGSGGGDRLPRFRNGLGMAREFIETDGYGLAQVHGTMLFAGRDAHEPMAMAQIFIGEAALFRTEQKGDMAGGETLAEKSGGLIEAANRVLQPSRANGGGSDNERAILDGFGDGLEFRGLPKQRLGANSGTRLAKRQLIGIHDAQMEEAKVAQGAGRCANVERIARCNEHDPQVVGFGSS